MDGWLIVEVVLVFLLFVALAFRTRLGAVYQTVSIALTALVIAVCVIESLAGGLHVWSVGLGVVALACCGIELVRQSQQVRRRQG